MSLDILDSDGETVLATANRHGTGAGETLMNVSLPNSGGLFYVRVVGDASNDIQAYDLTILAVEETTASAAVQGTTSCGVATAMMCCLAEQGTTSSGADTAMIS
jgi:hypothetical protein